ncbi:uncharacterized protein LOC115977693 isoform X2 [Quercus lobata]|uniref:uncharacterized protein LOC115977693 isoform X2 n=1 Tax=Quercus lobata TaxID=97700 RepID=UPI0012442AE2|nr:uncharacterized protein LOC115977693 isoform X2 [Quercus lobata]
MSSGGVVVLELPLGAAEEEEESFELEKAVCSHGLFMMPPNQWDPVSKTLLRPLRLGLGDSESVMVRISQHQWAPRSLHVRVYCHNSPNLSRQHRESVLAQVSRMLRLSEDEERAVREFRNMYDNEKKKKESSFVGRVFRSPTLFEDMVKCMLLCNCQTLSMARALCELQLELQPQSSSLLFVADSAAAAASTNFNTPKPDKDHFIPNTPIPQESKVSTNFTNSGSIKADCVPADIVRDDDDDYSCLNCKTCQAADEPHNIASDYDTIGNFPSPTELANLDEGFLASRCNLGYRASRILKLARDIVEGRIQLTQLEEASKGASFAKSSNYDKLAKQLKEIDGFGTFTCANVLMCMGYYHVIPTDSETIRHLRKVHARNSTVQTVQRDIERVYGKYAPFQFLAYWSELWHFYEKTFGKLSEMPCSDYKLITASNMESTSSTKKRKKKC